LVTLLGIVTLVRLVQCLTKDFTKMSWCAILEAWLDPNCLYTCLWRNALN
jgi:hypothetical protein